MTITRKSVMTVYCWPLIGLFLSLALLFAPIQTQEAYAEGKKVSGTCKVITQLARANIPCGGPGAFVPLWAWHSMLNSDDPDWNNVQRFYFQYDDITKEGFFLKGTGKFKGITGSVVEKGKTSMAEKTWEWEAEYEIR